MAKFKIQKGLSDADMMKTAKVETIIGKMLLDIQMEYFKEGEGDFSIQVKRDGKNIVLETAPKKVKPEK